MDRSLVQFVYLLVAVACIFIIILGIQSSAYVINAILLASLITVAVLPIPTALIKRGWNATLALIATLVVVVGVIILLLVLTSISVGNLSEALANGSVEGVSSTAAEAGQDEQTMLERLNNLGSDEAASQALSTAIVFLGGVVGQSITVVMIMLFMLGAVVTTPISQRFKEVGGQGMDRFTDLTKDVQQYISITTVINALTGLINATFLWIVGVEFAVLWGILAWLTGYIPVVGFWLGIIPPVLLAWVQLGPGMAIVVFLVLSIINGGTENFVKPRMMGEGLNISPLVIFVSLVFWGWVLGGVGAILAVPLTLMVLSILRSFDATKWIARLVEAPTEANEEKTIAFQRLAKVWDGLSSSHFGDDNDRKDDQDGEKIAKETR